MDLYRSFKMQTLLNRIPEGPVVAAVSGGVDSVCMLHLLWRLAPERKWKVNVAYIQHHLRGKESLMEQKFVQAFAKKLGVPCQVRPIALSERSGTEEMSRTARYRALARIANPLRAGSVLTAHHADDQAETLLLNLIRGAGGDGLAALRPVRPLSRVTGFKRDLAVQLVRPLLFSSRSEIKRYVRSQGLEFFEDSSNESLEYRRNWVRKKLIPLIETVQPKIAERLADLSRIFQRDRQFLNSHIEQMRQSVLVFPQGRRKKPILDLIRFFQYHIGLRYRFLHHLWPQSSYSEIDQIHAYLEQEKRTEICSPFIGISEAKLRTSRLRKDFPNRDKTPGDFIFRVPGSGVSREWNLEVTADLKSLEPETSVRSRRFRAQEESDGISQWTACLDADKVMGPVKHCHWKIRSWKPGDRFRPFGAGGTKKLQDFFVDNKIPRHKRHSVPLLEAGKKIRWVVGYRTDEGSRIDSDTKRIVQLKICNFAAHKERPRYTGNTSYTRSNPERS